jgi:hypothetical protein
LLENKGPDYSGRKTFRIESGTIAVKAEYQGDVEVTTPLYLLLSITYFFKVDEAIKSVIDSYYLTKDKKSGLIQRNENDKYNG